MARNLRSKEKDFQRSLTSVIEGLGWQCFHLEPPTYPGFPDITAKRGNLAFYAELKDGTRKSSNTPIFHFFEDTQPPFYMEFVPTTIWCLFDLKDHIKYYRIQNREDVLNMWNITLDDISTGYRTIEECAHNMIWNTIEDVKDAVR